MIEQAGRERIVRRRRFITEHPRQEPRDGINHHHRRQFATGQYEIAQRQLKIHFLLQEPLIEPFVASAEQDQIRFLAEPLRPLLVETTALRSEEHTSELQSLMRISYAVFCLKKKKT